ncbi:MAG: hypothetical protein M3N13_10240 [Candidatus Eremiobacteraeota bacterium]|nr:hypothetical protein [Candidatus Eremiobacteraeota bacterium]
MGKHLAIIAWLVGSFALFPHVTYANDAGPGKEVRAVRATARTLLAARVRMRGIDPAKILVDSVNVDGSHALASWRAAESAGTLALVFRYDRWWDQEGYVTTLGPALATFARAQTRAPTEAESWHYFFGGNAWVYFTIEAGDAAAHQLPRGTTISIWCPFVLDGDQEYSLTLAKADAPIGPIVGSLRDNTLTFVLPEFLMPAGAQLRGEVDGNPRR